ncbi:MAG: DUF3302 domain-containing protein [Gammaproteobacteria bacterium]|nr:DUF3302 domain-containing protein [Gammaproteobacteria bacterium]
MFLDYFALGLMLFAMIVVFYLIIAIHDIPYEIAKKRHHPHLEAIHVAGWVSLLTLHVIWPFLWIWATMYSEDKGYGFARESEADALRQQVAALEQRLAALEAKGQNVVSAGQEA